MLAPDPTPLRHDPHRLIDEGKTTTHETKYRPTDEPIDDLRGD